MTFNFGGPFPLKALVFLMTVVSVDGPFATYRM